MLNMTLYDVGAIFSGMMFVLGVYHGNYALAFFGIISLVLGYYYQYTYNPLGTNVIMFGVGASIVFIYLYHQISTCK